MRQNIPVASELKPAELRAWRAFLDAQATLNCATDRRGTWAILTPAGNARLRRAQPLHLRGVRQHFARRLSAAQLDKLADALEPLAADARPADGAAAR